MLHVGTDEAGYGPLLGPLVVAAAVYECDGPRRRLSRRGVDDSKVVYGRGGRGALARALGPYFEGDAPRTLSHLLAAHSVCGDPRPRYPWYPDVTDATDDAGRAPAAFRSLYVNPVCEREFNAGCRDWGGKGMVLFRETMRVVERALADHPDRDAEIVCDKHGGRNRYAGLLLAELRPSAIVTERETAASSRYRLTVGERAVRIRFESKADAADPPAALASMAAKYMRELFMEGFNSFFAARIDGLRPTAGYYADGRRFLADIEPALAGLRGAGEDLVRCR